MVSESGIAGKQAKVTEALRAGPSGMAVHATVKDWDGTVLREGTNGWVCYPSPEGMPSSPMCLDAVWEKWAATERIVALLGRTLGKRPLGEGRQQTYRGDERNASLQSHEDASLKMPP